MIQPTSPAQSARANLRTMVASLARDPLYRNSAFLILNTIILTSTGIVFWLIAARLVNPDALGIATSVVAALTALSMFARLGIDVLFLRYLHDAPDRGAALLDSGLTLCLLAAILASGVFAVGTPLWAPDLAFVGASPTAVVAFAAAGAIFALAPLMDAVFTASGESRFTFFKNAVYSVSRIALLALVLVMGANGIITSLAVAYLLSLVVGAIWVHRVRGGYRPRVRIDWLAVRPLLRPALPSYAVSLVLVLPLSVGSLIALNRFGAADAAHFYILWTFGSLSMLVPNAFGQASLVEMVRQRDLGVSRGLKPVLITAASALAVLAAGLLLLPLFGGGFDKLGLAALLPFALAAVPGFWFQVKVAQLRTTEQNAGLLLVVGATVGLFLVGLSFLPVGVAHTGWIWAGALTFGLLAAMAVRLAPAEGYR